jgi:tyrosinase
MRSWVWIGVVLLGLAQALPANSPSGYQFGNTSGTDQLAAEGFKNLAAYRAANGTGSCTLENAALRKEWSALTPDERKEYIAAVLCIQSTPNKFNASTVPGSRSRYDDFVANHIMGTNALYTIHEVGQFLSWHRYYLWNYERALRTECGYTGYQPYWNWGKYAHDPINSPLFDGSDTSMSGNGEYVEHPDSPIPALNVTPHVILPAGQGGGCVTSGPFKNFTVNLGGQTPLYGYNVTPNPQPDGLGYNPRCMRRDISQYTSSTSTTDQNTTDLITQNGDIASFQDVMQTIYQDTNTMGVHGGGHFTIAGDPGYAFHSALVEDVRLANGICAVATSTTPLAIRHSGFTTV